MNIRQLAILVICFAVTWGAVAQPRGIMNPNSGDTPFGNDAVIVVHPNQILVKMELRSSAETGEEASRVHLSAQADIFDVLDAMGATYEGQTEEEFSVRKNTSFVRRQQSFQTASEISATLRTDEQLTRLGRLIDEADNLEFQSFSLQYSDEDAIEEIQKDVINRIIEDVQDYQKEQSVSLTPRGISKMDILSESFGEEVLNDLLDDNRIPDKDSFSNESIELIGIEHQISAELLFY